MSRTYKDIGKGLWNNGIKDKKRKEIKKFLKHCNRHNSGKGNFLRLKKAKIEKIFDRETVMQVVEYEESKLKHAVQHKK